MIQSANEGFVYVFSNPAMPGLLKIGATTKEPEVRAKELSASTSAPLPFEVAYARKVAYPFQVEAAIHKILRKYRANESREFFEIELMQVIEILNTYDELRSAFYEEVRTPWAELFRSFPDDGSERMLTEDEQRKCRALSKKLYGR